MALVIVYWGGDCGVSGLNRDEKETKYHSVLCAFLHMCTILKRVGWGRGEVRTGKQDTLGLKTGWKNVKSGQESLTDTIPY